MLGIGPSDGLLGLRSILLPGNLDNPPDDLTGTNQQALAGENMTSLAEVRDTTSLFPT